jgi:glycosyltransferase involved in cell wall biosynthesis
MNSICQIVQNVYDIDPRVRRKTEALVKAGYSVDVLALRPTDGQKSYTVDGVNVRTITLGKKRGSLVRYFFEYAVFFFWVMLRAPWQMLWRKYAVIDVNTLPDFLIFAPFLARWMGAKLVLDMHEITPEFYMSKYHVAESSSIIRAMTYLERISMRFADHVLTVNDSIENLLVSRGLSRAKSTVIMNAANESRFAGYLNESTSSDNRRFVMIYHGTLTRIYGLDIAIEAFALAHKEMSGAELWILGSGSERKLLDRVAQDRGIADKVKLVGQVPADMIAGWLSQASAGILPLRRDVFLDFAFPNKLGEFIVMGRPVLMSRLRAIEHHFSGDALAYFEPENPADLARQMIQLYRDPQLRARLVARAKEEYAPIRWDLMKQRYLKVVSDLVKAASRRPAAQGEAARP